MFFPLGSFFHAAHLLAAGQQVTLSFHFNWDIAKAVLALLAGILVLVRPKNLNLIVAAYLILLGVIEIIQLKY